MPIQFQPTSAPDALEIERITICPQAPAMALDVALLKARTEMVEQPQPEPKYDDDGNEIPQEPVSSVEAIVGYDRVGLKSFHVENDDLAELMQAPPEGDTLYDAIKNALNTYVATRGI